MTTDPMRAAFELNYPNHANAGMYNHHDQMWIVWKFAWQAATAQATADGKEDLTCAYMCGFADGKAKATAAERERAALVCEAMSLSWKQHKGNYFEGGSTGSIDCADAIRQGGAKCA